MLSTAIGIPLLACRAVCRAVAPSGQWRDYVGRAREGGVGMIDSGVYGTLDEISGAPVFTAERSRQGYRLKRIALSRTDPTNRATFVADEISTASRSSVV
jgi:hypothetical protein